MSFAWKVGNYIPWITKSPIFISLVLFDQKMNISWPSTITM